MEKGLFKKNIIYSENPEELKIFRDFLEGRRKGIPEEVLKSVEIIVSDVKEKGDEKLLYYTKKFDGVELDPTTIKVGKEEIDRAYKSQDDDFKKALEVAAERIYEFHKKHLPQTYIYKDALGNTLGRVVLPFESAGCYVPGGRASYPSTVLMTVIPAKVAKVNQVISCVPPQSDGNINEKILSAFAVAKPDAVFRVGGAQAIAAMAYGTQTIPRTDAIVGPGNIFIAAAKKVVCADVAIDMFAGPSELAIIADEKANPKWIAYDLIAQAEHDPDACTFLLSDSESILKKVLTQLEELLPNFTRYEIISKSLTYNGWFIKTSGIKEAMSIANEISPEHLELQVRNADSLLYEAKTVGAIFLGSLSAVSFGDYILGPNHTLPTQGTARFSSPLSSRFFLREMNVIKMSNEGILNLFPYVESLAEAEGLIAHSESARVRFNHLKEKGQKE